MYVYTERAGECQCNSVLTTVMSPWSLCRCSLHCFFTFFPSFMILQRKKGWGGWEEVMSLPSRGGPLLGKCQAVPSKITFSSRALSSWVRPTFRCFWGCRGSISLWLFLSQKICKSPVVRGRIWQGVAGCFCSAFSRCILHGGTGLGPLSWVSPCLVLASLPSGHTWPCVF